VRRIDWARYWREPIEPWSKTHQNSIKNVRSSGGDAFSGGGALSPKPRIAKKGGHRPCEPVGV